jgi:hypothetical protein
MRHAALLILLTCSAAQAQLVTTVSRLGALDRVSMSGRLVGQGIHLRLVKPAWAGDVGRQGEGGGLQVTETRQGSVRVFRGQFSAEGKPVAFEERLEATGQETRLHWKITPSSELQTELMVVMVDLPVAGNAGHGSFLTSDGVVVDERPLPATLPDPYHIAGADRMAWCAWQLPGGAGLQMIPDGKGITGVSLQDNRQFGGEVFEAQFPVVGTSGLKARRTYEFGLTLRPFGQAAYQAEKRKIVDLAKSLDVPLTSHQALKLRGLKLSAPQVPVYGKLELTLDLDATFDNPFDPADIDVMATFTGPQGRAVQVPGFFYQGYEWYGPGSARRLRAAGTPVWKVRFAPPQVGPWSVRVAARDRSGSVASTPARFQCVAGKSAGFVRRTPGNPYYLQFDNGQPYFAVGENICWGSGGSVDMYQPWFKALGAAGGNYCRIWLVRWNMALEWTPGKGSGTYYGVGKYSQDNAFRLDWVMDQARRNGIHCMLCLGYHGELMDTRSFFGENCWEENPYAQTNGGPCATPADFWTNPQARKLYQQRLRYYLARYGWDSQILSWELWNEVQAPAPWVKEMAGYLRANDPSRHLVTTTYGYDEVWKLPEVDYTQAHTYGTDEDRPQTARAIGDLGLEHTTKWPKPFMVGEFGIDWKTSDAVHDPQGVGTSLHDGLWASVMTRSFGTAAIWYWDGYVHPLNMYHEFTSVRKFVDTIPWPKLKLELAQFDRPTVAAPPDTPWGDLRLRSTLWWEKQPAGEVVVNADGTVGGASNFSGLIFSPSKPDLTAPLRFRVSYPRDSKLILHVGTVSQGAVLHVLVDGREVWSQDLPCAEGQGPWEKAVWSEQYKIWQNIYNRDYEVPIPAGEHAIEISNSGKDWLEVTQFTFAGCRDPRYVPLDLYGLRTPDFAILWLHDQESNWLSDQQGKTPQPVRGATTALAGLRDGAYRLEWWDTRKGAVLRSTTAVCKAGKLPVAAPAFTRDIAAKVMRVR